MSDDNIKSRIAIAKAAFNKKKTLVIIKLGLYGISW
jgi:hypothetical protein